MNIHYSTEVPDSSSMLEYEKFCSSSVIRNVVEVLVLALVLVLVLVVVLAEVMFLC